MSHPALTFDSVIKKTPARVRLMVISRLVKYDKSTTKHQKARILADMTIINECDKFTRKEAIEILAGQPDPIRKVWCYKKGRFQLLSDTQCPNTADIESSVTLQTEPVTDPFIARIDAALHQVKQLSQSLEHLRRDYHGITPRAPTQTQTKAQQHSETMRVVILPLLAKQRTLAAIADELNEQGFRTQTGKLLSKVQVSRIIHRLG